MVSKPSKFGSTGFALKCQSSVFRPQRRVLRTTVSRVAATRTAPEKSDGFMFENVIFHTSNLHARRLYLDKPVLQELLYSAVGTLNTIYRVAATNNAAETSHGFIFENIIFHASNLHAGSLYLDKPVL